MGEISQFVPEAEARSYRFPRHVALQLGTRKQVMIDRWPRQREINTLSASWLADEVERERQKPLSPGETPWYHLSGTGFFVREQVAQLLRNTRQTSKEIAPDILTRELSKVAVDIRAFEDEYLKGLLGLKLNLAWQTDNGRRRIVCPDYHDVAWESVTDKKEREGAVYEAFFGKTGEDGVEGFLRDAPESSYAIVVSPEGWSGLTTTDGKAISYPETQVYVAYRGKGDSLSQVTLRYKADIFQNEMLQQLLGQTIQVEGDQKERVKQMVKNVAYIKGDDPSRKINSLADIIHLMQKAVGGREEAYDGKTFQELLAVAQDPEQFRMRHPLTEPLITRLSTYASDLLRNDSVDQVRRLEIATAITVLQMHRAYFGEERKAGQPEGNVQYRRYDTLGSNARLEGPYMASMDYKSERDKLSLRGGCAGGGEKVTVTSAGVPRTGVIQESLSYGPSESYSFDHEGECVVCKNGPRALGPCEICRMCDAVMGGKAAGGAGA